MKNEKALNLGELEKTLIQSIPGKENADLKILDKVDQKFKQYLKQKKKIDFINDFEKYKHIARELHNFIKENRDTHYEDTGIFHHDESKYSLFDVCKNLLETDKSLGNCLGLSQLGASLLSRQGIPVETQTTKGHVRLNIRKDKNSYPVDLSSQDNLVDEFDHRGYSSHPLNKLISLIHQNLGSKYVKEKNFKKAIQSYSNYINLGGEKEAIGYEQRAKLNIKLGNLEEALKDYEILSNFDDYYENINFQKAKILSKQGKFIKAGKEYIVGRKKEKILKPQREEYKIFGN